MPDENKLANIEPETREETFLQDIADGTQTLTPAVRKEEFLRRIAAKPGLPSITESDEGKVLTVESGEAVWGEGGDVLPEGPDSSLDHPVYLGYRPTFTSEDPVLTWTSSGAVKEMSDELLEEIGDSVTACVEAILLNDTTVAVENIALAIDPETHNSFRNDFFGFINLTFYFRKGTPCFIANSQTSDVYSVKYASAHFLELDFIQIESPYYFRVNVIVKNLSADPDDPTTSLQLDVIVEKIH